MKPLRKIASELFGLDRRERRATFVLATLLMILVIVKVISTSKGNRDAESDVKEEVKVDAKVEDRFNKSMEDNEVILFTFDPNVVSFDNLVRLGMTERQAHTLINYRNSGAVFKDPEDIGKVYGLDSLMVDRLLPWIIISGSRKQIVNDRKTFDHDTITDVIKPLTATAVRFVDLNKCDVADLEMLPGIGPVLSERVLKYRRLLGGFVDATQLREVYGIDSATYELVRSRVIVSCDSVIRFDLDSCTFAEMARHPYFGTEVARAVIKYRTLMGGPVQVRDLVDQHVINTSQAELIRPYVTTAERLSDK